MQDQILETLGQKADEMAALSGKSDVESLATLSAKRRFFKVQLQSANLWNIQYSPEFWAQITENNLKNLYGYLSSLEKLLHYSRSEERKKWNESVADSQPEIDTLPISFDWFVNSSFPKEWEPLDFLSRCERIYGDQNLNGPGSVYTRIFDKQVKMVADFEDGQSLKLISASLMAI